MTNPTWTAKIMPDSELGDSLVGRMLIRPEVIEEAEAFMDEHSEDLGELAKVEERERPPLGELLLDVDEDSDLERCSFRERFARNIEALRDWMPRTPPQELVEQWCNEPAASMASMTARTMEWVRAILTEQARIAREGE